MKFGSKFKLNRFLSADFYREILDLLIEITYLAAVFLVPLWFAYLFPTYNIFDFNKMAVFKILVWLLLFFTSLKLIFFHSRLSFPFCRLLKKYWVWPLVFIIGLSSTLLFSDNPLLSFYGTTERQGGLVSYLFYFFWFILVSFNILTVDNSLPREGDNKAKKIGRIIMAMVVSASAASIYGILQIMNIDFVSLPESAFETNRVSSSLGQPNFLASWLLLVIPLSLYAGYGARRFLVRFFYFLAAALQIICLFLTGSRGGLLALFFAGALYLAYLFITASWPKRRKIFIGLGFIAVTLVFLVAANRIWPGRISDIFDYRSGSVAARANFYSAAADSIKARPLFGYGIENEGEIFIRYYEPDWAVHGDVGQSADRAHNLILDILLTAGFYGLILFSLLYYFFFSLAGNNIRRKRQSSLSLAIALGAAAYLFSLLFSFSVVVTEIYFWLLLALLTAVNHGADETEGKKRCFCAELIARLFRNKLIERMRLFFKIILALLAAAVTFWQISAAFQSLMADYYFNKIYFTLAKPDYFTALTLDGYLKEQKINPIDKISYDSFWGEKLSDFYSSIPDLAAKKIAAEKLEAVSRSLPDYGYRSFYAKAKIQNALGHYKLAQLYLDRVIAMAPYWPLAYMEQGKLSANQNDLKKALIAYNLALVNLPSAEDERLNDPHRDLVRRYQYFLNYRIAEIYEKDGKYAAAEKHFQAAYGSDPSDYVLLKRMADMEYRKGSLKKAIEYTEHGLMRNPADYKWSVALASLYYESGDKRNALECLEKALELEPGSHEIKGLLLEYNK